MNATEQWLVELRRGLHARQTHQLLRTLQLPQGVDLTSNDYLGLAADPQLAAETADFVHACGAGSGASRLLRGHAAWHVQAEAALAAFCGREAALLFSSGFSANVGVLPALLGPKDSVFSDAYNHASLIDGIRLSRAQVHVYPHQHLEILHHLLQKPCAGRKLIVTESLFSMDGDLTPLAEICALAHENGAAVYVDEAHATGLYGARGSGLVEALNLQSLVLATMHTGGKALGVGGAWIAGDQVLVDHLINHSRSFVFSTAALPALAGGLLAAARLREHLQPRVDYVLENAQWLRETLQQAGLNIGTANSLIVPVILGSSALALQVAAALQMRGWDVRAVRPPTVPLDTARLRVTVRAPIAQQQWYEFAQDLLEVVASA